MNNERRDPDETRLELPEALAVCHGDLRSISSFFGVKLDAVCVRRTLCLICCFCLFVGCDDSGNTVIEPTDYEMTAEEEANQARVQEAMDAAR